jgi:hypothetical protein
LLHKTALKPPNVISIGDFTSRLKEPTRRSTSDERANVPELSPIIKRPHRGYHLGNRNIWSRIQKFSHIVSTPKEEQQPEATPTPPPNSNIHTTRKKRP